MVVNSNVGASALYSIQGIKNAVESQAQVVAAVDQVQEQAPLAESPEPTQVNRVSELSEAPDSNAGGQRGSFLDLQA